MKRKRLRGFGSIRKRKGGGYQICYSVNGKRTVESVALALKRPPSSVTERDASHLLKQRITELQSGTYLGPQAQRVTVGALIDAYLTDCLLRQCKTVRADVAGAYHGPLASMAKRVRAVWGDVMARDVTAAKLSEWAQAELAGGAERNTVANLIGTLRAAYKLGRAQGRVREVPLMPSVGKGNVRQDFVTPEEFDALVAHLEPLGLAHAARFSYATGWRKSEVFGLTWPMVDKAAGEIRLPDSKNGRGKVAPLVGSIAAIIDTRWKLRAIGCPYVFHEHGKALCRNTERSWARACVKAGFWKIDPAAKLGGRPTKLFHGFRRSAVRDMDRAGVPRVVGKKLTGHLSDAVYDRYNIVPVADLRDAVVRLEAARKQGGGGRMMLGWHFTNGYKLRDGQPLEAGRTYTVSGSLSLCSRGLHASERAIDALAYAPGCVVSRVELGGEILRDDDKACAAERRVLWCADADRILREFAIAAATDALEMVEARGYKVDPRSRSALRVAAAYLAGTATRGAMSAAQREAWAARSNAYAYADAADYADVAYAAAYVDVAYAAAAVAADVAYAAADADAAVAYVAADAAYVAADAAADAARHERRDALNEMLTTMLESLAPDEAARRGQG